MDFCELIDAHIESQADITIAAQPVNPADATQMGIFRFDALGHINGFEEKPNAARLAEIKSSAPHGADRRADAPTSRSSPRWGSTCSRARCCSTSCSGRASTSARRSFPAALGALNVHAYLYRGYWADVGTIEAFYDANIQLTQRGAPFNFFHPHRPIYTHQRFLPATRTFDCRIDASIIVGGLLPGHLRDPRLGRRHPHARRRTARRSPARSCSAPTSTRTRMRATATSPLGIGTARRPRSRHRGQERPHRRRRPPGQRSQRRRTATATAGTSATASSWCRRARWSRRAVMPRRSRCTTAASDRAPPRH